MANSFEPESEIEPHDATSPCQGCSGSNAMTRRSLLTNTARFSALGAVGLTFRRMSSFVSLAKSKAVLIAKAKSVPVGTALAFHDPYKGVAAYVVQPKKGAFAAFSRICPHMGCTVNFETKSNEFLCPCHGSIFNGKTGAVVHGPAAKGLTALKVVETNGELYVES